MDSLSEFLDISLLRDGSQAVHLVLGDVGDLLEDGAEEALEITLSGSGQQAPGPQGPGQLGSSLDILDEQVPGVGCQGLTVEPQTGQCPLYLQVTSILPLGFAESDLLGDTVEVGCPALEDGAPGCLHGIAGALVPEDLLGGLGLQDPGGLLPQLVIGLHIVT